MGLDVEKIRYGQYVPKCFGMEGGLKDGGWQAVVHSLIRAVSKQRLRRFLFIVHTERFMTLLM